jgi:filamentous hemagglutinin
MIFRPFVSRPTYFACLAVGAFFIGADEAWALNLTASASAQAKNGGSSSASATSQTATAATANTAQSLQAAAVTLRSQAALKSSLAAFQALQNAQQAAQQAAMGNAAINLTDAAHNIINGLTPNGATANSPGGLSPVGGLNASTTSPVQVVDLSGGTKNQLSVNNGGSVTLSGGTAGSDQVAVSGAGSVTTTAGTVTATAGSVTTTTGGTLAANDGGTIALTAGSASLKTTTATMLTSNDGGSYTLNGSTVTFSANTATAIPSGATVSFTGSSAATVSISGAATVQLSGAGTMSLATAGSISTTSGSTSFTAGAVISSQAAGSTVTFAGAGSLAFNTTASDTLAVIVQPNTTTNTTPSFTTTGVVLATQGYTVPTTWSGVQDLTESYNAATGQWVDTVTQDNQTALLYWTSFNIGKSTTLDFDQSQGGANAGDWVAYNRILDPSLNPSQIFGSIQASGQVYVINQNGIIFNGSSQVNAHALVASTLPINTNLIASGLLENPDMQYLFTSVALPAGNVTAAYDPNNDTSVINGVTQANTLPNVTSGNIVVQEGATLTSPGSETGVGGKIALIAPTVTNDGDISSPDGQVILAAGEQVGFVAHPSPDATLRGLDVAVGQANSTDAVINGGTVDSGGSAASNQPVGLINAPEADVTIVAPNIKQDGIIESQTTVALIGRIDLLSVSGLTGDIQNEIFDTENGGATGGSISLGQNSITEIVPDYASSDTQVGSYLALPSEIYVEGASFEMQSGAQMIAPNATVTFGLGILNESIAETPGQSTAALAENVGSHAGSIGSSPIAPDFFLAPGQFTLDSNAYLDVSGSSDVQASVAENIVAAQLTDAVLENSPLQKDGILHGATVEVDVTHSGTNADGSTWVGSPLGDFSGYANLVEHTVGELTTAGGSVAVYTNGSVNLAQNSVINVSGGSIDYAGAMVPTTYLVTADGSIVNIGQASPDVEYSGIYNGFSSVSSKWGTSQTFNNGPLDGLTYDAGYTKGGDAGSLTIVTPSATLNGTLSGNTTMGTQQQSTPPKAGVFSLTIATPGAPGNPPVVNIVIQPGTDAASTDPNTIDISQDLFGLDGFGNATINTGSGKITVASDAAISTQAGSSLAFTAANIDVMGSIQDPSGSIDLVALAQHPQDITAGNLTAYDPTLGNITLFSGSSISAAGLTFDEMSNTTPGTLPFKVNGGSVVLSGADIDQQANSSIDASGGLARSSAGIVMSGTGGSISLTGYFGNSNSFAAGSMELDGTLTAYGIGKGGSLTLDTLAVAVGDVTPGTLVNGVSPLILPANFFGQGGFSSYSVVGSAGLQIENGTVLDPVLTQEVANLNLSQFSLSLISSSLLPGYPSAPVNLSFSAPGATGFAPNFAQLTLGAGASITLPASSSLSLTGQLVDIQGSASVPGGNITITGASTASLPGLVTTGIFTSPVVTVYLEDGSSLSVSGETITAPVEVGSTNYTTGSVLAGGNISITGNIVGGSTASISADGTGGSIDVATSSTAAGQQSNLQLKLQPYTLETIYSNGGSIALNGDEEVFYEGSLSAKPGNTSATGGSFTLGSGLAATYTQPPSTAEYPDIIIEQNGSVTIGSVTLGQNLSGVSATGGAYIAVDQFANSGFGSLIFNGNVEFQGGSSTNPIVISASKEVLLNLSSSSASLFADGSDESVIINAPYIAIGAPTLNIDQQNVTADAPIYDPVASSGNTQAPTPTLGIADPTFGNATLMLNATDLIDVTFLSLQNFGSSAFNVSAGDIRGGGLFYGAGNITLNAGQIYTPTGATFTVAAFGSDNSINGGTINIENLSGISRPLPYSAGGTLNIFATNINQDGNLEAPFGTINLGSTVDSTTGETVELPTVTLVQNGQSLQYAADGDTAQFAPVTTNLVLGSNSITSVSGVSGNEVLVLPYGTIENGTEWIAPNGSDITAGGLIGKGVTLQGNQIQDQAGSVINISGGGELFAYEFNPGIGGTNDILSTFKYTNGAIDKTNTGQSVSSNSFAIVPSYDLNYAPIDLTLDSTDATPYANSTLTSNVGNEIYLNGGDGIAAGDYAILPARYALLPNAYLVTPESGAAQQTSQNPSGSINVAGYTFNSLNAGQQLVPSFTEFSISSNAVVNQTAPYEVDSATTFLAASAENDHLSVPRLPIDAGQVVFDATEGLDLQGMLLGQAAPGGLGSVVDIGSSDDIYLVDQSGDNPTTLVIPAGETQANYQYLTLSAQELDAFGSGNLLIGGVRSTTTSGTSIDTLTSNIYVENDSSQALTGSEIILDSKGTINVEADASIQQTGGATTGGQNLSVGSTSVAGSGDGSLIRVSGDATAGFTRLGVNTADSTADLVIGSGASISGQAVTLDSSSAASIDPTANLGGGSGGQTLTLSAGAVSLQLDAGTSVSSAPGLVLSSGILNTLESSVQNLVFASYSSLNLYGDGALGLVDSTGKPMINNLTLQAGGIYGINTGGAVTINAGNVILNNSKSDTLSSGSAPTAAAGSSLAINANTISLGANAFAVDGFSTVQLTAANGVIASNTGVLNVQGNVNLVTPMVTGATGVTYSINALGGALTLSPGAGTATVSSGLGATLNFTGSSVALGSEIYTPSGIINVQATSGDVEVQSGALLKATGTAVTFGSTTGFTSGGEVNLTSATGNVTVDANGGTTAAIDVSAPTGGGNAGTVMVSAANGLVTIADKTLNGSAANGTAGTFNATIGGDGQNVTLSSLTAPVTDGGFTTMSFDVTNSPLVTVDGAVGAATGNGISSFTVTSENGGITVDNTINASGATGGTINLYADQGVTLTANAVLNVTGQALDDAGEGGTIDIETRGANGGVLNIGAGKLELGIGTGSSIAAGGTVHLRAPLLDSGGSILQTEDPDAAQVVDETAAGIAMDQLNPANITNAGSVVVEGYRVYQPSNGMIDTTLENAVANDVANFPTAALATQLGVSGNALFQIQPGIEIVNPSTSVNNGNLTLGAVVTSGAASYWDLSTVRTADGLPGVLTMRAVNDLVFNGSLTDGFSYNSGDTENVQTSPYTWDVISGESWSYRLVSGAQFNGSGASTANFTEVVPQATPAVGSLGNGSLLLGLVIPQGFAYGTKTATTAVTYAELIRTGTGDIMIDAGGSVDLLNQMATIYTAGQLAPTIAGFNLPTGSADTDARYERPIYGGLIEPAPQYAAQYTENGGNIVINALQDIDHLTQNTAGVYVADTSWQFPTNWLYRRGATSSTGVFDLNPVNKNETASTTWWIDFSNFFEGIGALGGGNVSLNAGKNIVNVDAVIPTNARMPITDSASNLVELGGGDLSVIAGGTIEGGTYYVERGTGLLDANTISSAGDTARITAFDATLGQETPLATTLFVGDSYFTVDATNDATLGSVVNAFLMPQGINNGFDDHTLFSTYSAGSGVSLSSLLGNITIQGSEFESTSLPGGLANAYYSNASPPGVGVARTDESLTHTPWTLTLDPDVSSSGQYDSVSEYSNFYSYAPPIFHATAFSGNINYTSDQTLAASNLGTLSLLANGTIEGAFSASQGDGLTATILVLDNDPSLFPGVTNPIGLGAKTPEPLLFPALISQIAKVYSTIDEAPSYSTLNLTTLEGQHTSGLLHDNDNATPVQVETISGDIEDFTLISPEKTDISSGLDLEDVSLYIQNNNAGDVSVVSANRDITLYDPSSSGLLSLGVSNDTNATFGDLQISGPGTLEVLAGGNLNLGQGASIFAEANPGTNLGIVSVGQSRNPFLPFGGADIIAAAGLGNTSGLSSNPQLVDYHDFIENYLDFTNSGATDESVVYLPDLGSLLGVSGATNQQIWDIFSGTTDGSLTASESQVQSSLTPESRDALATTIFYDVLRDAGRNHNNPASLGFGNYQSGYAAIATLFPESSGANSTTYNGDITLTSREIKTTNEGDINLLVPGGSIEVGVNNLGAQAVDQGILTVDGGNISIFTNNNVDIGTSRIFTLHGGNIIIWSSYGNIDAGASSRTVTSAPPTRVLVDSQSADVQTDLAGLATGGGIGVLETVVGAPPGDVDLIAPVGTVDAGDAGIRASGNVNVAAAQVLNAGNIQAGGSKSGVGSAATPNIAAAVAGSNAAGSSQNAATASAGQQQNNNSPMQDLPSIITVQVLGFGGGDDDSASDDTPSDRKPNPTYLADHP